jgi:ubiquinone/menaquinone biosynthesis C-methylase UbiE
MERPRVDYDELANDYDARYSVASLAGIRDALRELAGRSGARRILEAGCGTGHWLGELREHVRFVCGADASVGMLGQARGKLERTPLVAARANALAFRAGSFDLIFSVNAVHHFDDPCGFIRDAAGLLRSGGILAILGIDPRLSRRRYFYQHFEGTYERDLVRYPSIGSMTDCMAAAGLERIESRIVERYERVFRGAAVFSDPFLRKNSNSLLALLSDAEYELGIGRMWATVQSAEAAGGQAEFVSELSFVLICGSRGSQAT